MKGFGRDQAEILLFRTIMEQVPATVREIRSACKGLVTVCERDGDPEGVLLARRMLELTEAFGKAGGAILTGYIAMRKGAS